MLVLSRKKGESIRIGSDIDVIILGVSRGRVRLGFAGSRDVPVRRAELLEGPTAGSFRPDRIVAESVAAK